MATEEAVVEEAVQDDLRGSIEAAVEEVAPEVDADTGDSGEAREPTAAERARDAAGRFAPKVAPTPQTASIGAPTGQPDPRTGLSGKAAQTAEEAQATQTAMRAPSSWRPEARELWASLPETARGEVMRREQEINRTLHENASARQFAERMSQTLQPYHGIIQANGGGDPFRAITGLLGTASALQAGSAGQKAQIIATIIKDYGVDIGMLDAALVNAPMPQQAENGVMSQVEQLLQQRLQPFQSIVQTAQQRMQQEQENNQRRAFQSVAEFGQTKEFFNDVRHLMADLMDITGPNGEKRSLEQAYNDACYLNPSVRSVILQRSTASAATSRTGAAQRARSAAVSVSGAPVTGSVGAPAPGNTIRAAIEHALSTSNR